jgi:hypothetical protein
MEDCEIKAVPLRVTASENLYGSLFSGPLNHVICSNEVLRISVVNHKSSPGRATVTNLEYTAYDISGWLRLHT